jgi:hypothetical protein
MIHKLRLSKEPAPPHAPLTARGPPTSYHGLQAHTSVPPSPPAVQHRFRDPRQDSAALATGKHAQDPGSPLIGTAALSAPSSRHTATASALEIHLCHAITGAESLRCRAAVLPRCESGALLRSSPHQPPPGSASTVGSFLELQFRPQSPAAARINQDELR